MVFKWQPTCTLMLACIIAACSSSMPPRQTTPDTTPPASSDRPSSTAPAIGVPAPTGAVPGGPKVINIDPKPETTGNPTDGIDPNIPLETTVTPKLEPIVKGTTKPYIVNGETVTPMSAISTPFTQTGHASWYGKKFHGRRTASGEPYDMFKLSAAHRTLPIPSYIRITNLSNGKTVMARVNDRGPFGRDRIIDLSYAAAKQLDIIRHGSAQVEISLIDPSQQTPLQAGAAEAAPGNSATQTAPVNATGNAARASTLEASGLYVQVGAFGQEENADRLQQRILNAAPETQSQLNKVYNGKTFQIVLGPYPNQALAAQAANQMRDKLQLPTLIFSR
ncbi:septal ring lytic transglycosylase RlpA family protein [Methylophilus medardicus]|uniref:Endolytic peptidoglycan transglycosylase RlpA n=1 Tax=Methylophilus medardicus TaxID=2588534 RepID=A0A5B8CPS5_9PROT|nr:septal ring lytic transglycosylase RlpA family protein [Methylophilus medardicus]QDC43116.1 septal ring lytic transglycosylase RlpA family protein [Methylophilus medardicus]QDC48123.1 septal ring lytic transglycosylase RlpA family protein [Methylophilus medardicus]QDC51828.1 septal ring lytic transglycosylase RlpA family protein [Methylophilus medardicus]